MKKKYFLFAGIVWLALAGLALYFYNEPHRSTADIAADLQMDAAALYKQYQQNEDAANRKFLDKIIEVKGKVTDAQQSATSASLELDGGVPTGGVNCSFSVNGIDKISLPAKGLTVTVKGRCSGFLMDVNLVDCVLEK